MDYERFHRDMTMAEQPEKFIDVISYDFDHNKDQILEDLGISLMYYKMGKYEKFGEEIAKVIKLFTEEPKEEATAPALPAGISDNKAKSTKILKGVLEAFGGHFNLENLLLCIY